MVLASSYHDVRLEVLLGCLCWDCRRRCCCRCLHQRHCCCHCLVSLVDDFQTVTLDEELSLCCFHCCIASLLLCPFLKERRNSRREKTKSNRKEGKESFFFVVFEQENRLKKMSKKGRNKMISIPFKKFLTLTFLASSTTFLCL